MKKFLISLQNRAALRGDDDGAAMIEYALVVAGIALLAAAAIPPVGNAVSAAFTSIAGQL